MSHTAVVILNYNGEKLLHQFLPSVVQYSQQAEIIVADNNSTDHSVKLLQGNFPSVRIIRLDKNYGFCDGYNRALKQVDADYYVLLNSDIEVTAGWLIPLTRLLESDATIAAVQPKVLSYLEKNKFEYAGAGGGLIDSLGYPFCRGRIFDYTELDAGQYNDEREVFWATGACMMIRSKAYHVLGGFDEDFFAHMEEIDLCWKLHRASQKVFYSGKSTVYHLGAGTLAYHAPKKTYLNFRNGLSLVFKHWAPAEIVCKLPLRIVLDWIAAIRFLLKGDLKNFSAIIQAHHQFLMHLHCEQKKRKELREAFPFYGHGQIYRGSIVFDYYIKRRKTLKAPDMRGAKSVEKFQ